MSWEGIVYVLGVLGIKLQVLIASVFGGFASLSFFEQKPDAEGNVKPMPRGRKWSIATSGTGLGVYGSGLVGELVHLQAPALTERAVERLEVGLGLILAALGMSLAAALVKEMPGIIAAIRGWLPGAKG